MNKLVTWHLCYVVIFLIASGCATSPAPVAGTGITEEDLTKAIQGMSFQRELAESYVDMARGRAPANSDWARSIQEKYGRAAALGNSFIDKLKLSLVLRKINAEDLSADVRNVAAAVNELFYTVNPPPAAPPGELTAAAILELITPANIDGITKSVITIWKAAQEREDKLIEDIKKELDRQRWKNWSQLRVPA